MAYIEDEWNQPEQEALRAVLAALEEGENAANRCPHAFRGDLGRAGETLHLLRGALECNTVADPEDMVLLLAE